jgi:hypothetical protein
VSSHSDLSAAAAAPTDTSRKRARDDADMPANADADADVDDKMPTASAQNNESAEPADAIGDAPALDEMLSMLLDEDN